MIELPKDAEGREIPLDTVCMYDCNGESVSIIRWCYTTRLESMFSEKNIWIAIDKERHIKDPVLLHLTPPDSWEKLLEDLDRASGNDRDTMDTRCVYFNRGKKCRECSIGADSKKCGDRGEFVFADIASRIRRLRGEN